ncbi:PilZ domain-containing protein [bacterium]|nr:PilZ domain-containing protein [candidate division CSSED10-310 bacterium]
MVNDPAQPAFNKRKYPRKPIRASVTYNYTNSRLNRVMTGTGFTVNLSKTGALIRIENYMPVLSELDLNIQASDGHIVKTRAKVVHCKRVSFNRYDVGLQFLSIKQET